MKLPRLSFGGVVPFALCGVNMKQNRYINHFSSVQGFAEELNIVTVHRTHIPETEILKKIAPVQCFFCQLFYFKKVIGSLIAYDRNSVESLLCLLYHFVVFGF